MMALYLLDSPVLTSYGTYPDAVAVPQALECLLAEKESRPVSWCANALTQLLGK